MHTRLLLAGLAAASLTAAAACGHGNMSTSTTHGGGHASSSMSGMSMSPSPPASSGGMPAMGGMGMPAGNGLPATVNGYTLTVHARPRPGRALPMTFTISRGGKPVTAFDPEQTKVMHFYLIRADLTGFQHLHPTMSAAGLWSVTPSTLTPGEYRIYTQFLPQAAAKAGPLVTSRPVTVPGTAAPSTTLPAPRARTTVDGYTLAVAGHPKANTDTPLTIRISRNGTPVTNLQPYLGTYAHVTAIHAGDLAFAHLHPAGTVHGDHGGPTLTVHADLPAAVKYRMFIQFQTAGRLHTAAITIAAS